MNAAPTSPWQTEQLSPFGVVVMAHDSGANLNAVDVETIAGLVDAHRVAVFRGFASLDGDALPEFCKTLGTLLEWDFGFVNELRNSADAQNYLYTNREVPFHWDGAFAGRIPRYIFFHCDVAPEPGTGGETLFSDTTLILRNANSATKARWRRIMITYSTEKIVHYGGKFSSPMICPKLFGNEEVIRYAEPVGDLNPVELEIEGIALGERDTFLNDIHKRLHDTLVCYRHEWKNGDIVIADNTVLLHGRSAFQDETERHIRRVNIL